MPTPAKISDVFNERHRTVEHTIRARELTDWLIYALTLIGTGDDRRSRLKEGGSSCPTVGTESVLAPNTY